MAFTEAGDTQPAKPSGLKLNWKALEDAGCPKCGDNLEEFKHIRMFKCGCGFKISESKFAEILQSFDFEDVAGIPGYMGDGFKVGNYHDESPF